MTVNKKTGMEVGMPYTKDGIAKDDNSKFKNNI